MNFGRKVAIGLGLAPAVVLGLAGCGTDSTPPVADNTAPAAVRDLRLVSPTPTSIEVLWTAPGNDSIWGTAAGYDLRYATSIITESTWPEATPCSDEPSPGGAGAGETFLVTGLAPDVVYYFALVTCDDAANCSGLSNVESSRTMEHSFVVAWGGLGGAGGQMRLPRGLAVGEGVIYVADTANNRLEKFTLDGALLGVCDSVKGATPPRFNSPDGLALGPDGDLYVADVLNNRVVRLGSDWELVGEIGEDGTDGDLYHPHSVAVDGDGHIYVADTDHHLIKEFTPDGHFYDQWGGLGSAEGEFFSPRGVAVGPDGLVYVADTGNKRVTKFTPNGANVGWGSADLGDYRFTYPRRVAVSGAGIFVVDSDADRVEEFETDGGFRAQWGGEGTGVGQFDQPNDVALDGSGSIYVLDTSNNRLQKFAPAGQ
jgi:sugar lactone lactonase YvrE